MADRPTLTGSEIAIVGMAARFPGASSIAEFWSLLRDGVDAGAQLSDAALEQAGVPRELRAANDYVRRAYALDDIAAFDADFFGISPLEASLIDPQQRLFLECAHEALDDGGQGERDERERVGVFGGSTLNTYLLHHVLPARERLSNVSDWQIGVANDKDCLAGRVSYKLNLRGPSVAVQTTCSTSLVAVHLACLSLLNHECDLALAGAASVRLPQSIGYRYRPEEMLARDGFCRAFDRHASGTVFGSGVGVVVLKRMRDAVRDRDSIHAVILGSASNNDGAQKVGFTAPSEDGQARVVAAAQAIAEVTPASIGYVEAHGTGTPLGDPIELRALSRVFRGVRPRSCALGSVKTNLGHLDVAAGIAGLIKAVLALKHRVLPASLHFREPCSELQRADVPFYVNASTSEWGSTDGVRRCGVSSFGVGGTNAHVILEEAPPTTTTASARKWHVLPISAKTERGLELVSARLSAHLASEPDASLADVAYTLQQGRAAFEYRRAVVCRDVHEAIAGLTGSARAQHPQSNVLTPRDAGLASAQLIERAELWVSGETRSLSDMYAGESRTRVHLPGYPFEREKHWLAAPSSDAQRPSGPKPVGHEPDSKQRGSMPAKDPELKSWFYAPGWRESPLAPALDPHSAASQRWLVLPDEQGLGKSFAERLRSRGAEVHLIEHEALQAGANILAGPFYGVAHFLGLDPLRAEPASLASFDEAQARGFYALLRALQRAGLARLQGAPARVLVVQRSSMDVGAEPTEPEKSTLIALVRVLAQEHPELECRALDVDASALESREALLERFEREWAAKDRIVAYRGRRRFVEQYTPYPLGTHSRPVFRTGAVYVLTGGLGRVGSSIARHLVSEHSATVVLVGRTELELAPNPLPTPRAEPIEPLWQIADRLERERPALRFAPDLALREQLEHLCAAYIAQQLQRTRLGASNARFTLEEWASELRVSPAYERFFRFSRDVLVEEGWLETHPDGTATFLATEHQDPDALGETLAQTHPPLASYLELLKRSVTFQARVFAGELSPLEVLFPEGDTQSTARALEAALQYTTLEACRELVGQLVLARARSHPRPLRVLEIGAGSGLLTRQLLALFEQARVSPAEYWVTDIGGSFVKKARAAFPPASHPFLRFATFDITRSPEAQHIPGQFDLVLGLDVVHATKSLRATLRNLRTLLAPGAALALLEAVQPARFLTLIWGLTPEWWQYDDTPDRVSSPLASLATWQRIVREEGFEPECFPSEVPEQQRADYGVVVAWRRSGDGDRSDVAIKRARLSALRERGRGAVHYVAADIADEAAARSVVADTVARYGAIEGVIHAAGDTAADDVRLLSQLTVADCEKQLTPKARGAVCLTRALREHGARFFLAMSSNASILGGPGLAAYAAANQFVDALVSRASTGIRLISANWDGWPLEDARDLIGESSMGAYAMTAEESIAALERVLAADTPRLVVSTGNLAARATWLEHQCRERAAALPGPAALRTRSSGHDSRDEVESTLTALWAELLGATAVDPDANFFDLGGDSIVGVRMMSLLRDRFAIDLPTSTLFDTPTIRGLTDLIVTPAEPSSEIAGSADRGERRRQTRTRMRREASRTSGEDQK